MISFAFFNQAGGSAKTTSALTAADALSRTYIGAGRAKRAARVSIFDADPQRTAYKWESRRADPNYPRYPVRVDTVSRQASEQEWFQAAVHAIRAIEQPDYLVIDTPPSLDRIELKAVLKFADIGIMPFQCHAKNVEALEELVPYLKEIQAERKTPLDVRLLVAKYNLRRDSEKELFNNVERLSPWPVLHTRLKDLVAFADAHNYHTSLYAFNGAKEAKKAADALGAELIQIAHQRARAIARAEEVE